MHELELIRRRVGRVGRREGDAMASRKLAECLSKCEILLGELVRGEEDRTACDGWRPPSARTGSACSTSCRLPACSPTPRESCRGVNRAGALLLNISASRLQGQMFLHFVIDRQRLLTRSTSTGTAPA